VLFLQVLIPGEVPSMSDAASPSPARNQPIEYKSSAPNLQQLPWLDLALDLKLMMTFFMEEQWFETNAHGVRVTLARRDANIGWMPCSDPLDEVLIEPFDTDATYSWCALPTHRRTLYSFRWAPHSLICAGLDRSVANKRCLKLQASAIQATTVPTSLSHVNSALTNFQFVNMSGSKKDTTVTCNRFDYLHHRCAPM
jgi:hypothetical protein